METIFWQILGGVTGCAIGAGLLKLLWWWEDCVVPFGTPSRVPLLLRKLNTAAFWSLIVLTFGAGLASTVWDWWPK